MKAKILIVEDDMAIQSMYKMKLNHEGYTVVVANDGAIGLNKALEEKPDLILLDLKMPNMDGEEMLIKLREDKWGEHASVVILTNISRDEAPQTLNSLGVMHYLVKALYTPKQVVQTVEHVLAR